MKHESKVEKFPGHIILPDNWNIYQLREFEKTLPSADLEDDDRLSGRVWLGVTFEKQLPALLACVSEWHIKGIPEKPTMENFPTLPLADVNALISWIYDLLVKMWTGEQVPNE